MFGFQSPCVWNLGRSVSQAVGVTLFSDLLLSFFGSVELMHSLGVGLGLAHMKLNPLLSGFNCMCYHAVLCNWCCPWANWLKERPQEFLFLTPLSEEANCLWTYFHPFLWWILFLVNLFLFAQHPLTILYWGFMGVTLSEFWPKNSFLKKSQSR